MLRPHPLTARSPRAPRRPPRHDRRSPRRVAASSCSRLRPRRRWPAVAAADGPTMEARVLLGGHARLGSWIAIAVHLKNDGPAVTGELRLAGGTQGQTQFGDARRPADPVRQDATSCTPSRRRSGSDARRRARRRRHDDRHDQGRRSRSTTRPSSSSASSPSIPSDIVGEPRPACRTRTRSRRSIVSLDPGRPARTGRGLGRARPARLAGRRLRPPARRTSSTRCAAGSPAAAAWSSSAARPGPRRLSGLPRRPAPLPADRRRPTSPPASPRRHPRPAARRTPTTLPALAGALTAGRALATVGDRVVAAERDLRLGLGDAPRLRPDGRLDRQDRQRRAASGGACCPPRTRRRPRVQPTTASSSARSPSCRRLALPPIGGLLAPAGRLHPAHRPDQLPRPAAPRPARVGVGHDAGPHRRLRRRRLRLRRRLLRGSDVIVNEVAIVRGAPGATEGTAQVYLGVFSPTRGIYQVARPRRRAPVVADQRRLLRRRGTAAGLDVLQGDPARVRDLAVGFGSLRTIRAETPVAVPLIEADLRLEDGRLKGTVTNASTESLERPAVVLGQTVGVLDDLEPGADGDGRRRGRSSTSSASRCRTRSSARCSSVTTGP